MNAGILVKGEKGFVFVLVADVLINYILKPLHVIKLPKWFQSVTVCSYAII